MLLSGVMLCIGSNVKWGIGFSDLGEDSVFGEVHQGLGVDWSARFFTSFLDFA